LKERLAKLGLIALVRVCATRLVAKDGFWTGHGNGSVVIGREKGFVVRKMAKEMELNLKNSFAYGNSVHDRWMLAAVGNAVAVNPSAELRSIAELQGWRVVRWMEKGEALRKAIGKKKILNAEVPQGLKPVS